VKLSQGYSNGQRVQKADIALSYIGVMSKLDFATLSAAEKASADGFRQSGRIRTVSCAISPNL
jgi:hypothetical protein